MSARRWCLTIVAAAAPTAAAAQGGGALAARVAAAPDGEVAMTYATRAAACGDGRDVVAVGDFLSSGDSFQSHGSWNARCERGPARLVVTVRGGAATDLRVFVGPDATAPRAARDLGAVRAADAAEYALALAGRLTGRPARRAVIAAAVADSADVWRPLLALARGGARDEGTRGTAIHWLGAVAPPEAVGPVTALVRDAGQPRRVREGGLAALAFVPDDAGVPSLVTLARGDRDAWLREKAVFWLGQTDAPTAHATLRALAGADTAARDVRAQALFALGFGRRTADDGAFIRALYPRLGDGRLREKAVMSVAQFDDAASRRWLLDLVARDAEPLEARKQALFWAGQRRDAPLGDLLAVYPRLDGTELRKHFTFVLSQRDEDAALERLIDVAAHDGSADVRHQAIFWLGQSRNPRAQRYLAEVIAR